MGVPGTIPSARAVPERPWPKWRVLLIRFWAALLTLQALMMAQGIVVVLLGDADDGLHFVTATSTVFKLLSLGGAAWVLWSGGRSVTAYWMILAGHLIWVASSLLVPRADGNPPLQDLVNSLILYGPLVALRPHRRELLHLRVQPSRLTTTVAAAGSCALMAFAWHLATTSRHDELAFDAVGLYLTLAVMSLFASACLAGGRWLIPLVSAGAAATGAAAAAFPNDFASTGHLGAALLLLWALVLAAAARREATTERRPHPATTDTASKAPAATRSTPARRGR